MRISTAKGCAWRAVYLGIGGRWGRSIAHIGVDPHDGVTPRLFWGLGFRHGQFGLPHVPWRLTSDWNPIVGRAYLALYRLSHRFWRAVDGRYPRRRGTSILAAAVAASLIILALAGCGAESPVAPSNPWPTSSWRVQGSGPASLDVPAVSGIHLYTYSPARLPIRATFNGAVVVSAADASSGDWRFATGQRGTLTLEASPEVSWAAVVATEGGL